MNNILVVNVNWLGDAIFSTPVFAALKNQYPTSRISCLCVPRVREVLAFCPDIDELITYDEKGNHRTPWSKLAVVNQLRQKKFDIVFLLHRSLTRAFMVYSAGIPVRVGYANSKGRNLLTHPVAVDIEHCHRSTAYAALVEGFTKASAQNPCRLLVSPQDIEQARGLLLLKGINPSRPFIVFNTGGNWDLKRWPLASWAQLLKEANQRLSVPVVFTGSIKDQKDYRTILRESGIEAVDVTGQTTLGQSLAVYQLSKAVVSADSGPLHLANSVGATVVGLFGATRPEITGPMGIGRRNVLFHDVGCNRTPCYHLNCQDAVCMRSIEVNDVCQAISQILSR